METFDPDLLRTFVIFADGGSLAKAADAVGRSPSAVTAQMQRLEALIGEPLLAPAGRGRALTPAGEELVGHARRILAAHREAWLSLKGARADGRIGLGITQDFADGLPDFLRTFARTHARVRIDLRVGRSRELTADFDQGALDILIAMRQAPAPDEILVLREPMLWLCASDLTTADSELPLALLDPPCGFRTAIISALDAAGRRYRIAATSASLSGVRAAVRSGIAITARTERSLEPGVRVAPTNLKLPKLPDAEFGLRVRRDAQAPAGELAALIADDLSHRRS
ncbi:MAG: LysR family transcriptional regulator [Xanthobacteraceae bacterium]|nr:LysR family transcriptional regulator [Xanthobacteraceae bacterium]